MIRIRLSTRALQQPIGKALRHRAPVRAAYGRLAALAGGAVFCASLVVATAWDAAHARPASRVVTGSPAAEINGPVTKANEFSGRRG